MRGILHHLPFREPNQETIAKSSKVSTERSYGTERPHELVKPECYRSCCQSDTRRSMMSETRGKTYRLWTPEHYRHEAHSPEAKLPQADLVFFLLDTVPYW